MKIRHVKILCTHPGRLGDAFWSLAVVRAVSEQAGCQVDFATSPKYAACLPIVEQQPYIRRAFQINGWDVLETAPMTPFHPPVEILRQLGYDKILNLGYTRWPERPLAFEMAEAHGIRLGEEDLGRPWIEVPDDGLADDIAVGFTDEWFELKVGLTQLVVGDTEGALAPIGSRWHREAGATPCKLEMAAAEIAGCQVFLGCLSSLAVLAAGMGKPRVLVEPNPHRHHLIFQHWNQPLVMGNDGLPTFDARHVAQALKEKLQEARG